MYKTGSNKKDSEDCETSRGRGEEGKLYTKASCFGWEVNDRTSKSPT